MAKYGSVRLPQEYRRNQGGGGGGPTAPTQQRSMSITMMPDNQANDSDYEEDFDYELRERIESLSDKFHEIKSRNRKGKVESLDVIDDGRISVPERLRLFLEAAVKKGFDRDKALEWAVRRLEEKGDDIAGDGSRSRRTAKAESATISQLLNE